ncbi:MAG: hypothetical protein ACOZIN_11935 [Myxococcota bacterium]
MFKKTGLGVVALGCLAACATLGGKEISGAAFNEEQAFELTGTLLQSEKKAVVVSREGLPQSKLKIVEGQTVVMLDGVQTLAEALPEGAQVRAMFQIVGDDPVAIRVEAQSERQQMPR